MIRRILPFWIWGVIAVFFMSIAVGISVGFSIYYVHSYGSNQCDALTLLVKIPAPKPDNPAKTPAQETNYEFHNALVKWANADGCL